MLLVLPKIALIVCVVVFLVVVVIVVFFYRKEDIEKHSKLPLKDEKDRD